MSETEIKILLDRYADKKAYVDLIELQAAEERDAILTPEIKAQLAEIDQRVNDRQADVSGELIALDAAIKAAMLEHGASVKGTFLHAIYVKGRVTWDSKKLDGLVLAYPFLEGCRKVGDPSVTFRKV